MAKRPTLLGHPRWLGPRFAVGDQCHVLVVTARIRTCIPASMAVVEYAVKVEDAVNTLFGHALVHPVELGPGDAAWRVGGGRTCDNRDTTDGERESGADRGERSEQSGLGHGAQDARRPRKADPP